MTDGFKIENLANSLSRPERAGPLGEHVVVQLHSRLAVAR